MTTNAATPLEICIADGRFGWLSWLCWLGQLLAWALVLLFSSILLFHPTFQRRYMIDRCAKYWNDFPTFKSLSRLDGFALFSLLIFVRQHAGQPSFLFDVFSIIVDRYGGPESSKNTSSTSSSSRCDAEFYESRRQRTFADHNMFDSAGNYDFLLRD